MWDWARIQHAAARAYKQGIAPPLRAARQGARRLRRVALSMAWCKNCRRFIRAPSSAVVNKLAARLALENRMRAAAIAAPAHRTGIFVIRAYFAYTSPALHHSGVVLLSLRSKHWRCTWKTPLCGAAHRTCDGASEHIIACALYCCILCLSLPF